MENPPITIAAEVTIHEELRKAIQHIADNHKIKIEQIDVEWRDLIGSTTGMTSRVHKLEMRTVKLYAL